MNTDMLSSWPALILSGVGIVSSALWGKTAHQLSTLADQIEKEAEVTTKHRESVRKQLEACKIVITEIGVKVGVDMAGRFNE